ncbi:hypothetical protein [Tunicatimonas pelagia]|uniref:hypothetical protein n=1 Tax=Tunicatimonas pelagia TaxID=931531 RepID=UPI0026651F95|nr:hypothetical protein [Tunicatimonas pelagia]WKN43299.1 hypothetical protein P0M28_30100 [Tunicatimonas pelagia]
MIAVSKAHRFSQYLSGKVTPYLTELLVYVGQDHCYASGARLIEKLLHVPSNATQIYRLVHHYGQSAATLLAEETPAKAVSSSEVVYVEIDGGMLLTREQSWQEAKIGRVFCESDCYKEQPERGWIKHSEYVAHLGHHRAFEAKMAVLTDKYEALAERMVVVSDGAPWIKNWVDAAYPRATQILDFYHVKEHLAQFAHLYFSNAQQSKAWLAQVSEQLLQQGGRQVVATIGALKTTTQAVGKAKAKLLRYCQNNTYRMDYPYYVSRGWMIGSGAIEAAQRTVAQQRLKLSGQRGRKGAQRVLDLRALNMSDRWHQLQDVIRNAA